MSNLKNPYRCETCKKFFPYDDRKIIKRRLYTKTIEENACPYCGSWNITSYSFGNSRAENKYLNYDVLRDKRYYSK